MMNLCTEQPAVTRRQLLLLLLLLTSSPLCSRVSASARARSNGGGGSSSRRVVRHLPGFDGPLPFELETGYVEVDHIAGVRLFYYFIRSERRPAADDDPLLLWLTGGPGCSAFSGLVYEVGPLTFDLHGRQGGELPRLLYKPESWTKRANVIFLDSPVGTGFSYAADDGGAGFRIGDTVAVRHILVFLRKWLQELHPDLLSNPLYIAGDSYSGLIVPAVALGIATSSPEPHQPSLNLKGYLLGNPVTDHNFDTPSKIPFAHRMGLISDELYKAYKKSCSIRDNTQQQSVQCNNTLDAIDEARIISTYFVLQFSDAH
uniref:Serine carboxypeptidase-like 19 n=1 Tax=Oryza rufipogon TaxID=4529 RepID=A0A0E0RBF8_ORYRU